MKFYGQRRKAEGSRIKDNEGGLGFSLVPFAVRPAPISYASFLGISEAWHLDIFHQPLRSQVFDSPVVKFSQKWCAPNLDVWALMQRENLAGRCSGPVMY
jgi:hypothetical protein